MKMKYRLSEEDKNTLGYIGDIDLDYLLNEDYQDIEDLREAIQEAIYQEDIIYYSKAIEFLRDEDQSLTESLELAGEIGYSANQLNSELLATILYQGRMMGEIDTFLELLQEIEE